jgi:hypothetical protein
MATLIQSKQIEGVVTASVVDGVFIVSGSQVLTGSLFVDGDITASNIVQASQFVGDGSRLTGVVAEGTGINLISGSVDAVVSEIRITGSGAPLTIINSNTASIEIKSPYEVGGLFRLYDNYTTLTETSVNYFTDGQIVYVKDTNTLYQSTITYADFVNTFTDTIVWNIYTFAIGDASVNAGDGLSKSVTSGITTISLNTGSIHFQSAVEHIISSGSFMIDAGTI